MNASSLLPRRAFLASAVVGGMAACASRRAAVAADAVAAEDTAARGSSAGRKICAFIKFLQTLDYGALADTIAELGFDGVEATVRANGIIPPERVEEQLPKLVEALAKRNLEITVMTTDVNRADHPLTERVLRTAANLGVRRYRMAQYKYDLDQPIVPQLDALRPVVAELAALNRSWGISAVYQNHSGSTNVGATLWDLQRLIADIPPSEIGVAFDIRHATVEGGLSWPTLWKLMQPHLGVVYVKDFHWVGRKAENVPLGQGQVNPAFFKQLARKWGDVPISLHVEYLEQAGIEENVAALRTDLKTLRELLA